MNLIKYILPIATLLLLFVSCRTPQQGFFATKTPHEQYKAGLDKAGLSNTRLGALWVLAANASLAKPVSVTVPYKETGYFEMGVPMAAGYAFSANQGEVVMVNVSANPVSGFILFTELWQVNGADKKLLAPGDTTNNSIRYEIKTSGRYIVRLQPELLQGLAYTITISTGPSLAFPVNKEYNPKIISVWGDSRDANARSHEGIDILAGKYTPVVACADGTITSVREGGLGGKVVFMRPGGSSYNFYYAHLDTQLVQPGQRVFTGDRLGLIGNTGNARFTAAHLHFGIYGDGGAVDPLPFLNLNRPIEKTVKADTSYLAKYVRTKSKAILFAQPSANASQKLTLENDLILKVIAATDDFYKVELTDSSIGFIKSSFVNRQPLRKATLSQATVLLDRPGDHAAAKKLLSKGAGITVLGMHNSFYYVKYDEVNGWVKKM